MSIKCLYFKIEELKLHILKNRGTKIIFNPKKIVQFFLCVCDL